MASPPLPGPGTGNDPNAGPSLVANAATGANTVEGVPQTGVSQSGVPETGVPYGEEQMSSVRKPEPPPIPRNRREFLRYEATPSTRAVWLLSAIAGGFALLMMGCGLALAMGSGEFWQPVSAGMAGMPLPILLLAIAGLIERKPLARTLLFAAAAMLSLIAALFFVAPSLFGPQTEQSAGGAMLGLCLLVPIMFLFGLPTLFFGVKVPAHLRRSWEAGRSAAAAQMVRERGMVTVQELAAQLEIEANESDLIFRQIAQDEEFAVRYYPEHATAFGETYEKERQRTLVHTISARGQVRLDELTRLLKVSSDVLHTWLVQLVGRNAFRGYINWQTGILFSEDASALGESSTCPQCSGRLQLSGKKLVLCSFCGAEIFL